MVFSGVHLSIPSVITARRVVFPHSFTLQFCKTSPEFLRDLFVSQERVACHLFMIYSICLTLCSRLFVFILRTCTAVWENALSAMQTWSDLDLRMPLHAQTDHSLSTFWSGNPFMPLLFIRNRWLYSLEQLIKQKSTSWVTFLSSHFWKHICHYVKALRLIMQSWEDIRRLTRPHMLWDHWIMWGLVRSNLFYHPWGLISVTIPPLSSFTTMIYSTCRYKHGISLSALIKLAYRCMACLLDQRLRVLSSKKFLNVQFRINK